MNILSYSIHGNVDNYTICIILETYLSEKIEPDQITFQDPC
jgi:hypothetical protein